MHSRTWHSRCVVPAIRVSLLICLVAVILAIVTVRISSAAPSVLQRGLFSHDPDRAYQGYTIYPSRAMQRIYLLDMDGNEVHSWTHPSPDMKISLNPKPLPNGNLLLRLRRKESNSASDNKMVELDWNSNIVWKYYDPDHADMHHDHQRLDNGNTLILLQRKDPAPTVASYDVKNDYIIEVNQAGEIEWQWYSLDHFEEFGFSNEAKNIIYDAPSYGDVEKGDIFHSNSLQALPPNKHWAAGDPRFRHGNILVSQRNTKIVFIIDKASGDIAWKIGPDDGFTIGQHAAYMIPYGFKGAGNILIYDNGGQAGYPTETRWHTRVIEVDPITNNIEWEYTGLDSETPDSDFFSRFQGYAQRLPNGNTLINEPYWGRIFEVTRKGKIVWEYVTPHVRLDGAEDQLYQRNLARAYRVDLDWPTGPLD